MTLFSDFLAKKHKLAVDAWGADDSAVRHVYKPLIDLIAQEVDEKYRNLYPCTKRFIPLNGQVLTVVFFFSTAPVWAFPSRVGRLSRCILITEHLIPEWADHFIGKTTEELDELAASFKFEHCLKRDGLNKILMDNASLVRAEK